MGALAPGPTGFGDELLQGALLTIELAVASVLLGLAFGLVAAVGRLSGSLLARAAARGYADLIRGIPEFLVVLVVYYGAGGVLTTLAGLVGLGRVEVSAFAAGTLALGLVFGAFASEVFRGAYLAVPRGQQEAGAALGLPRALVLRHVVMPQMWRHALPGLGNLWLVLLKDTALVSVIALDELLRWSKVAAEATGQPFTFYLAAAAIYLLLTALSNWALLRAERRAARGIPLMAPGT